MIFIGLRVVTQGATETKSPNVWMWISWKYEMRSANPRCIYLTHWEGVFKHLPPIHSRDLRDPLLHFKEKFPQNVVGICVSEKEESWSQLQTGSTLVYKSWASGTQFSPRSHSQQEKRVKRDGYWLGLGKDLSSHTWPLLELLEVIKSWGWGFFHWSEQYLHTYY